MPRIQHATVCYVRGLSHLTPYPPKQYWHHCKKKEYNRCTYKFWNAYIYGQLSDSISAQREWENQDQERSKTEGHHLIHSFTHRGPIMWNSLPDYIKTCGTLHSFKAKMKLYIMNWCAWVYVVLLFFNYMYIYIYIYIIVVLFLNVLYRATL